MARKTFYVTTPIYYPSSNLHLGHVYTTTLAWVLRNYKLASGYDAIMLTGADEHGQKIEIAAQNQNISPQLYVDKMTKNFKNLWSSLKIDYDLYSRTTNINHKKAIQKQFNALFKNKQVYLGKYKGLYSIKDEEFLTKLQARAQGGKYFHPVSGHELETIETDSYFFKMSNYQTWLKSYYQKNPKFIIPQKIVKELSNNFLDEGLEDLSISRQSFDWGIPIQENKKHIIYVWLDALNNYLTALGYNQEDNSAFKKYWVNGNEIVHIVGKEITRFHCIYWPIILKANSLRQPTTILSHGWIITPEGKMSKSKGNVIDPYIIIKNYGYEELKYYLASQITIGQDSTFEIHSFLNVINADLVNNVGNLVSRVVAMVTQNFSQPIGSKIGDTMQDRQIIEEIKMRFKQYKKYFNEYKISEAIKEAIILAKKLNGYIDLTTPWKLTNNKSRLELVLSNLLNGIYAVSTMLKVVIPEAMDNVREQIGISQLEFKQVLNFWKFKNAIIKKGAVIFKRQKFKQ